MDGVFEKILRASLPGLPVDEPVRQETLLAGYGLDSLGMVRLAADLEAEYHMAFPDRALVPETFRDAGTLWSAVVAATAATGQHRQERA